MCVKRYIPLEFPIGRPLISEEANEVERDRESQIPGGCYILANFLLLVPAPCPEGLKLHLLIVGVEN